jgi:hypothetical protein
VKSPEDGKNRMAKLNKAKAHRLGTEDGKSEERERERSQCKGGVSILIQDFPKSMIVHHQRTRLHIYMTPAHLGPVILAILG